MKVTSSGGLPRTDDARTDDDGVGGRWGALRAACARAAQRYTLEKVDVVADDRRFSDDDAHTVVDEELFADARARVDLDTSEKAPNVREQPGGHFRAADVQRVRETVDLAGVESRVREDDLQVADGGRVALACRLDIAFNLG